MAAISLWETKEHAENYNRDVYAQVEEVVNRSPEGIPVVKKIEPHYSTFHKVAFAATA